MEKLDWPLRSLYGATVSAIYGEVLPYLAAFEVIVTL